MAQAARNMGGGGMPPTALEPPGLHVGHVGVCRWERREESIVKCSKGMSDTYFMGCMVAAVSQPPPPRHIQVVLVISFVWFSILTVTCVPVSGACDIGMGCVPDFQGKREELCVVVRVCPACSLSQWLLHRGVLRAVTFDRKIPGLRNTPSNISLTRWEQGIGINASTWKGMDCARNQ
jgi:hypothetical protein